jgi:Cu/Ag efflux pump CusA
VAEIRNTLSQNLKLPEGYRLEYGGQFESARRASRLLFFASAFAVLFIFIILYQEFRSMKLAGVILVNLPLALIGGVMSVWLSSGMISIPAIIGFITLFGIAVRNGILLVSRYQHLLQKGMNLKETIIGGSADRLNPILMTALASALALIPLALGGNQPGNEIQSPMAVVILGGLLTSTFLNLFVVPVVFYSIHAKKRRQIL